jgi:hypothetical protein
LKTVDYEIKVSGLPTTPGSIPVVEFKEIIDFLLKGCDRVLRLIIEGRSIKSGKNPDWLKKSLNFIITGITTGSTLLQLEAPVLGESVPEHFKQKTLWDDLELVKPGDTSLTLLSKAISDAASENMESYYFDANVLDALLSFKSITKNSKELIINSKTKKEDSFKVSNMEIKKIKKLKIEIPKPHTTVLSGFFNLIEHSNQRFQLKLPDGRNINGIVDPSYVDFEKMRELWGRRVTIKGKAYYKPSGNLRSIEAQLISPSGEGDEILEKIPQKQKNFKFYEDFLTERNANKSLEKIWGKWPGDESIDELLNALEERNN